jgi:hypothetical protein
MGTATGKVMDPLATLQMKQEQVDSEGLVTEGS